MCPLVVLAQPKWELGFVAGGAGYQGGLAPEWYPEWEEARPLYGLLLRRHISSVWALRVDFPGGGLMLPPVVEIYITLVLATLASINLGLLISAVVRSSATARGVNAFCTSPRSRVWSGGFMVSSQLACIRHSAACDGGASAGVGW